MKAIPNTCDDKAAEDHQENIAEGMEAEEGDFVSIQVAFSFKSKNAHLYLAFYMPGGGEVRFRKFRFPSAERTSLLIIFYYYV